MNFLEIKCITRDSVVYINTDKIESLRKGFNLVNGDEVCIILTDKLPIDGKGFYQVKEPVDRIIRRINTTFTKSKIHVSDVIKSHYGEDEDEE